VRYAFDERAPRPNGGSWYTVGNGIGHLRLLPCGKIRDHPGMVVPTSAAWKAADRYEGLTPPLDT
jgi:hypothetical protein